MVYQAKTSFHTVTAEGTEEFVPKGKVFPDSHLYVKRDEGGNLFEKLDLGEADSPPPAPAKAAPAKKA